MYSAQKPQQPRVESLLETRRLGRRSPEAAAAALSASSSGIIGDMAELGRQARVLALLCDYPQVNENDLEDPTLSCPSVFDTANCLEPTPWGTTSAASGRAAAKFIETATELCLKGKLDAIVTAPINKESLRLAGSPYPGHTEMLTALCGSNESLMCFFAGDLRVILLTFTYLADAIKAIPKKERQRVGLADGTAEV